MDALFALLSIAALFAIFGTIAAIVGEDTRDGFGDHSSMRYLSLNPRHR